MGVAPAKAQYAGTGHFELLIDDPQLDLSQKLAAGNDKVKPFDNGQTETALKLPAGKHTLQLLLVDWKEQPFYPGVASDKLGVTMK